MNLNYKNPKNSQEVAMNALEILKHSYLDPTDYSRNPEQTKLNAFNYAKKRGLKVNTIDDLKQYASGVKKCDVRHAKARLTIAEAKKALETDYAKENLEGYSVEDLRDISRFKSDGISFYTIDESNYESWLFCDDLKKEVGRPTIENPKNKITSVRMTENDQAMLLEKFGSVQLAIDSFLMIIKKDELK